MKKISIFLFLPIIIFVLSACYKSNVEQSIYSDGSMVVKAEYDFYDFIKTSIEYENQEIPDEYDDLDDYVLSKIKELCKNYKKESEYNFESGLIFSSCSTNEKGKMIFYSIFLPETIDIEKNNDIYTFSIVNLVDYLDLPIPYEENKFNANFKFQADVDNFLVESASLKLDSELSPVSGDFELDIDIDFKFLFEGEIMQADIGEVNNNELVFNFEELFYFDEGGSPKVKVRVNEVQPITNEYTINYKIEDINKVSLNVDLDENHGFFEKLKSSWQINDLDLDKIINNDYHGFSIYINNDYYNHGDYYEYKLENIITTISEGSQLDFIKLKLLDPNSIFNIVINFENEILESNFGIIENNKLSFNLNNLEAMEDKLVVKVHNNKDLNNINNNTEKDIILISSSSCPHCVNARNFLDDYKKEKSFTFIEYNMKNDYDVVDNLFDKYNISRQYFGVVPLFITSEQYYIGFSEEIKNNLISIIDLIDPNAKETPTSKTIITNQVMYNNLKGRILLQVESAGEAYYIHPNKTEKYFLGRPDDAFSVMREQGIGITNSDLAKIPVSLDYLSGPDTSGDGLPDDFKIALGLDVNSTDSDGDGYCDFTELYHGFDPLGPGRLNHDLNFAKSQAGRILLQVEQNGEAWYVGPENNKRYFLGRPADAFSIMRNLGLGISNENLERMIE